MSRSTEGKISKELVWGLAIPLLITLVFFLAGRGEGIVWTLVVAVVLLVITVMVVVLVERTGGSVGPALLIGLGVICFVTTAAAFWVETHYFFPSSVSVLSSPIHLGDKAMDSFEPAEPSGLCELLQAQLPTDPRAVEIRIRAKSVDPVVNRGPLILTINDGARIPVNSFEPFRSIPEAEEHTYPPTWGKKKVPAGLFRRGINNLTLCVHEVPAFVNPETKEIITNADDVNVFALEVAYR